jgi:hypothetical protein
MAIQAAGKFDFCAARRSPGINFIEAIGLIQWAEAHCSLRKKNRSISAADKAPLKDRRLTERLKLRSFNAKDFSQPVCLYRPEDLYK